MPNRLLISTAIVSISLGACVSTPAIDTKLLAGTTQAVSSFSTSPDPQASDIEKAVVDQVSRKLIAAGWQEVSEGGRWHVETIYSVRPQQSGTFSDSSAIQGQWINAPDRSAWWHRNRQVHSLLISVRGPSELEATATVSAVTTRGAKSKDDILDRLTDAAVSALTGN